MSTAEAWAWALLQDPNTWRALVLEWVVICVGAALFRALRRGRRPVPATEVPDRSGRAGG